jgi:hypothetical protein
MRTQFWSAGVLAIFLMWPFPGRSATPIPRNAAPGVGYVGSKVCAGCHAGIYKSYLRTAMGRSITLGSSQTLSEPVTIRSQVLDRLFTVSQDATGLYQSESQEAGGRKLFENKQRIEYVIGSGENGKSYAVRRGDYLFQAPLSYYTKTRNWDLSPGFESSDQGFNRPIYDACIACHAGRPQAIPRRDGLYRNPPFLESAIGCENCHGPGQLHVAERGRGHAALPDPSIVNPARLPARLAEDICMKCHQGGDTRALLPGKDYTDFRPGTPLIQTVAIVSLPLRSDQTDLLEHHVSMRLSKCYRASAGKLSCLTCHNPHEEPTESEAPGYFRQRCLTCHNESSCRVSLQTRLHQEPADNCIGCHMPKRDVAKISHAALTNHRIPARLDQPTDLNLPGANSADLPGLLLLNPEPQTSALPDVTKLAVYGDLLNRDPELQAKYLDLLNHLSQTTPDDPLVQAALGRKALLEMSAQAVGYLSRAVAQGTPGPGTFLDLAKALAQQGRSTDAIDALGRGITLFPYSQILRKHQILSYIQAKDYRRAEESMDAYVKDFPEDAFMRKLLNDVRANSAPK